MADRYGRRPVLLAGVGLYALSGFAAAAASSPELLFVARLAQAFGGCAGLVIARAIVRDVSIQEDAARDLAKLNLIILIGPGIGPVLGGFIAGEAGWRAVLALLGVLGLVNFAAIYRLLPETGGPVRTGDRFGLRNYGGLLRSRRFMGYAVGGGCVTTTWYAYISAAPFIYQHEFGQSAAVTGIHLGIVVTGAWIGNLLAARTATRVSTSRILLGGHGLCALMAVIFLGTMSWGASSPPLITAIMFLYTCGVGFAGPAALAEAMEVDPGAIGSAAGLYGFAQMAAGAIAAALASLGSNPGISAGLILVAAAMVAQACLSLAAERRGRWAGGG
ncbi:MAG: hypothetical protein B7Z20_10630 [Sphingobium sp. 32-64-5]|nr:MAG: hypothetical protein B7Z20_10630 [Sphingobium sp. 32-64-5]